MNNRISHVKFPAVRWPHQQLQSWCSCGSWKSRRECRSHKCLSYLRTTELLVVFFLFLFSFPVPIFSSTLHILQIHLVKSLHNCNHCLNSCTTLAPRSGTEAKVRIQRNLNAVHDSLLHYIHAGNWRHLPTPSVHTDQESCNLYEIKLQSLIQSSVAQDQ